MKRARSAMAWAAVAGAMLAAAGPAAANMAVGGGCTLPGAIEAVNSHTNGVCGTVESGVTTITVPAGHYTLTGTALQVKAGAEMALVGANSAAPAETKIDANTHSRVFEIASGGLLRLENVEVTGGRTENGVSGVSDGANGAEAAEGGGILNKGNLKLEHVLLDGNATGHGGSGGAGNLTLSAQHNGGGGNRGGAGGGIYNAEHAILEVIASTITGNETGGGGNGGSGGHGSGPPGTTVGGQGGNGGYGGSGGAIDSFGSATILDSTISGNKVGRGGEGGLGGEGTDETEMISGGNGGNGGEGGNGGVVYSEGGIPTYGEFAGGGGIASFAGSLQLIGSTVVGNETGAGGHGGTGGTPGETSAGHFRTSGKAGHGGGGGLGGGVMVVAGAAELTNDTIVENRTGDGGKGGSGANAGSLGGGAGNFGGYGAGVWTQGATGTPFHLNFLTISKNVLGAAGEGGDAGASMFSGVAGSPGLGGGLATGEAFVEHGVAVDLGNSIVAGNGGPQCAVGVSGNLHNSGGNVSYPDASCEGVNADPLLGALANNGGLTETMLPATGSAAIGAVPIGICSPREDQRGILRPGGGKTTTCDAGAVETTGSGGGGGGGGEEKGGGGATAGSGGSTGGGTLPAGGSTGTVTSGGPTVGTPSAGGTKVKGTTVSVPITCAGPTDVTCIVKLILASAGGGGKGAPRVLLAKGKGAKAKTVGVATASIPGGSTKTVSVSLNGAGKKALGRSHKLKTTLTVSVAGAATPLFTHTVTFAAKG
jgi:hypothetical protein